MNITALIAFLSSRLLEWERKINLGLDYLLAPTYALNGANPITPRQLYFYNPPRQSYTPSQEEIARDESEYLKGCTLTAENCCEIAANKIDRAFRQWLEWVISITDSNCLERVRGKEFEKKYPKEVDMAEWRNNNFRDFVRNQVTVISRNAALVVTQDKNGDWVILHIRCRKNGRTAQLIVKACEHTTKDLQPSIEKVTKSGKHDYAVIIANWKCATALDVKI